VVKVTVLGVGGAFTDWFYHTNYLVEVPGVRMLIDGGTTLRYSLMAAGYIVRDIDRVVLTHFHSDHVGGLEELAQRCRYMYQHRPAIFAMADQIPLLTSLFALHGAKTEDYFNIITGETPMIITDSDEGQFQLEYFSTKGLHAEVTSNYIVGLRRTDRLNHVTRVVFTGDIGPIEQSNLGTLVADPDTIAVFHDCYTGKVPSHDHPSLEQLERFYPPAQRSKIHLIHYGDNISEYAEYIKDTGFKLAIQGETYTW
jgi:phosphoribosyl 1,2-cyclic phosphodiesterase